MKKKCRVYKKGGSIQNMKNGGTQAFVTQDSKKDPIPKKKSDDFLGWLQSNSQQVLMQKQMEAERDTMLGIAKNGMESGISTPGVVDLKGKIPYNNFAAWDNYNAAARKKNMGADYNTVVGGLGRAYGAPDVFKYEGERKKGFAGRNPLKKREKRFEANPLFDDPNTDLDSFEFTEYGKKGKNRYLKYKATGHNPGEEPAEEPLQEGFTGPMQYDPKTIKDPFALDPLDPFTGHVNDPSLDPANQQFIDDEEDDDIIIEDFDQAENERYREEEAIENGTYEYPTAATRETERRKLENMDFGNLGRLAFRNGGQLPKAQDGSFNPDTGIWETDENIFSNMTQTHGAQNSMQNLNNFLAGSSQNTAETNTSNYSNSQSTSGTDYSNYSSFEESDNGTTGADLMAWDKKTDEEMVANNPFGDSSEEGGIEKEGEIELKKQGKWKEYQKNNPWGAATMKIAGLDLIGKFGESIGIDARNEATNRKNKSEIFNQAPTYASDRGDYDQQGRLRPDEYDQWGENTKVAEDGLEIAQDGEFNFNQIDRGDYNTSSVQLRPNTYQSPNTANSVITPASVITPTQPVIDRGDYIPSSIELKPNTGSSVYNTRSAEDGAEMGPDWDFEKLKETATRLGMTTAALILTLKDTNRKKTNDTIDTQDGVKTGGKHIESTGPFGRTVSKDIEYIHGERNVRKNVTDAFGGSKVVTKGPEGKISIPDYATEYLNNLPEERHGGQLDAEGNPMFAGGGGIGDFFGNVADGVSNLFDGRNKSGGKGSSFLGKIFGNKANTPGGFKPNLKGAADISHGYTSSQIPPGTTWGTDANGWEHSYKPGYGEGKSSASGKRGLNFRRGRGRTEEPQGNECPDNHYFDEKTQTCVPKFRPRSQGELASRMRELNDSGNPITRSSFPTSNPLPESEPSAQNYNSWVRNQDNAVSNNFQDYRESEAAWQNANGVAGESASLKQGGQAKGRMGINSVHLKSQRDIEDMIKKGYRFEYVD